MNLQTDTKTSMKKLEPREYPFTARKALNQENWLQLVPVENLRSEEQMEVQDKDHQVETSEST